MDQKNPIAFARNAHPADKNLKNCVNSPQTNSASIKLLYYLDYHSLVKGKKQQRSV